MIEEGKASLTYAPASGDGSASGLRGHTLWETTHHCAVEVLNGRVDPLRGSRPGQIERGKGPGEERGRGVRWQWELLRAQFFAAEPAAAGGWAPLRRSKVRLWAGSKQMFPVPSKITEREVLTFLLVRPALLVSSSKLSSTCLPPYTSSVPCKRIRWKMSQCIS